MKWIWKTALAGTLIVGTTAGCGRVVEGVLTAAPAFFISEEQEVAIGVQAANEIVAQVPVYADPTLQTYVRRLGEQLAVRSPRADLKYYFTVLRQDDPNAFALPGGFIFVTTGILKLMQNEAQLAGVLAHEIGHVAERHSLELVREAALAQGVQVAVLGNQAGATAAVANVVRELLVRGYGRQKELEADRVGARYATQVGYAPAALSDFLQILERATGGSPAWLAPLETHPPVAQRVTELQNTTRTEGLTGSTLNQSEFLRATASLR